MRVACMLFIVGTPNAHYNINYGYQHLKKHATVRLKNL